MVLASLRMLLAGIDVTMKKVSPRAETVREYFESVGCDAAKQILPPASLTT